MICDINVKYYIDLSSTLLCRLIQYPRCWGDRDGLKKQKQNLPLLKTLSVQQGR
jgi:hypothetical protein